MTEYLYAIWFAAALGCLIIEINIMTIYLIALAIGAAAGGVVSLMGSDFATQSSIAGIVTILASIGCFYLRRSLRSKNDRQNNQLDMGQRVVVKADAIAQDGSAKVKYRGADWTAYTVDAIAKPGIYTIEKLDGSRIVLGKYLGAEVANNTEQKSTVES